MKNANIAAKAEKEIRQFVRAQFSARVVRIDGEYQTKVTKTSARVLIRNPVQVLAALREKCGRPIAEDGKTTTFKMKKAGTVEVTQSGETTVLKLHNAVH